MDNKYPRYVVGIKIVDEIGSDPGTETPSCGSGSTRLPVVTVVSLGR